QAIMRKATTQRTRRKAKAPGMRERCIEKLKAAASPKNAPVVTAEERRHLAECCAFFKAQHYREAEPGKIREQDIEVAEAEIEAIVRKVCGS
ncbi:MAG: hypothetical protein ACXW2I_18270, partial [Burkholderiales bacterium]